MTCILDTQDIALRLENSLKDGLLRKEDKHRKRKKET